ncbi:MAG: hypothetical protein ACYC4Q_07945, partial [Victivallaceae bacterium]
MRVTATGSVGIGTTTINQKLDVAGNINVSSITNAYYIASAKILHQPASDTTSVGIGLNSLAAQSTTGLINVAIGGGALQDNTSGRWNVSVGGNALWNNTTGEQNVAVGQISLGSNTTGHYNTAVGRGAMNGSLTPLSGSNNTAVGYTALQSLEAAASQNTALGATAGDSITTGSGNILIGYGADVPAAATSNFMNIGSVLYGDLANAEIGIGTTSPTNKLHVHGAAGGSAGIYLNSAVPSATSYTLYNDAGVLKWNGAEVGASATVALGTATGSTNPQRSGDATTGLVSLAASTVGVVTAGVESLRVTATGSVGIGTTVPSRALDVVGAIKSSTDIYFANSSGTLTPVDFRLDGYIDTLYVIADGGAGAPATNISLRTAAAGNTATDKVRIDSTGNVGIGTATPAAKLHVEGGIKTSRLGNYGTYNSAEVQGIWSIAQNYYIDTASNDFGSQYGLGYAYCTTGGAPFASQHQIVLTNNGTINSAFSLSGHAYFGGNVGIGTSAPDVKLAV